MIQIPLSPGRFQQWSDVPVSTKEEFSGEEATLKFSADSSLSEKVQRVFNGMMFFIVGAKLLSFIPPIASLGSTLSGMGFAAISGTALLKIPAVATIMALAPQMIVTLALIVVIRKVLAVAICHIIYPAVIMSYDKESNFRKVLGNFVFIPHDKQSIDQDRSDMFDDLNDEKFECRRMTLNKSGIDYDAFVFEHETTKGNGHWVVVAGGNGWIGESAAPTIANAFKQLGLNILFVNGPGVGRSSGLPTSYSIQAGQEAGLQFLEKVVEAEKILIYGASLGGGAQAEVIRRHEFKTDIDYMVWSDRSFDKLSNAASSMVTILAKPVFFLLGIELDGVAGARKLQELGIIHIVTQNSNILKSNGILPLDQDFDDQENDGVIPNKASLYVGLKKAGFQDSDRLKCYGGPHMRHNGRLRQDIEDFVNADIKAFVAKA